MIHKSVSELDNKWQDPSQFPKRLEWLEINNVRGWTGQRVNFNSPITAIVGENGAGKSTVLQAAAIAYSQENSSTKELYAATHFPDTPFDKISNATIRFSVRQGDRHLIHRISKQTIRWRGYDKRPKRAVQYLDLSRIQPLNARSGYLKLLKNNVQENAHDPFDNEKLARFTEIMGRTYEAAGISKTDADAKRSIPVLENTNGRYSGFHQGAGETTAAELLAIDYPKTGLIIIDEIETSLHPRAQRKLIRSLAQTCRVNQIQMIISTHSPYILDELPENARILIMNEDSGRKIATGVSSQFAMTMIDEDEHPDFDLYVEDDRASVFLREIVSTVSKDHLKRCKIKSFGAASVGKALAKIPEESFDRPSLIFLDGDQNECDGCELLPGKDAPERVVFGELAKHNWLDVAKRIARGPSDTIDALNQSMTSTNHKEWLKLSADRLNLGTDTLWQTMCSEYALKMERNEELMRIKELLETLEAKKKIRVTYKNNNLKPYL